MTRTLRFLTFAACALALPTIAPAADQARPNTIAIGASIDSCADSAPIRFAADDKRALLDAADSTVVSAAIVKRYPMVEHDGFAPTGVVLWRRPQIGWVYVTLMSNPAKASEFCFTGSFGADKFDLSAPLIDRYFGAGAAKR